MLLPRWINPLKTRSIRACLGKCNDFQVICSGMIAKAFQRVGYPIVPGLYPLQDEQEISNQNPYGDKLVMRHYSQVLPRDFDLSPNFEIIKGGAFDYKSLQWGKCQNSS